MPKPPATYRYLLRSDFVREHIDAHHLTQGEVADRLAIGGSYWSTLLMRKQGVSPPLRRRILACALFAGIPETALWERVDLPPPSAGTKSA